MSATRYIALAATLSLTPAVRAAAPAFGQEKPATEVTMKVDKVFAGLDRPNSPGCALGIIKDGEFVYRRGYGMASLEYGIPLSSESVFYIGSTSKQFVSASILLAAEQGHLALDDDIRKHVPEIPDYGKTITIRNLIHHTSGLRDYLTLWSLAGENIEDIHSADEALQMIARQTALNFDPGDEYLYSNSGYLLLSVIVERATGKSLREFAEENIFKPLGMENTHFHDDHTHPIKNRAIGHFRSSDGSIALNMSNFSQVGSGGLYTSVDDLLLWDRNFYDNQLGDGGLIERMLVRGVLNDGDTLSYAAALQVGKYRGLRTVAHGGALGGYRAQLLRFPDQRFSVICLCNVAPTNPTGFARQVADVYLADKLQAPQAPAEEEAVDPAADVAFITLANEQLERLAGPYRDPASRMIIKVTATEGKLRVQGPNFVFHMSPLSPSQFVAVDAPMNIDAQFQRRDPGRPSLLNLDVEGQRPSVFEPIEFFEPNAAGLAEYAGEYYSEELDATWRFIVEGDSLYVADAPDAPFSPTVKDEFRSGGLVLSFIRGDAGHVIAVEVDAGRVRRIGFARRDG